MGDDNHSRHDDYGLNIVLVAVGFFALCVHSLAASLLQAPGAAASAGFGGYVGSSRVDTASPFEGEVPLVG
jgi:hypothetical protein